MKYKKVHVINKLTANSYHSSMFSCSDFRVVFILYRWMRRFSPPPSLIPSATFLKSSVLRSFCISKKPCCFPKSFIMFQSRCVSPSGQNYWLVLRVHLFPPAACKQERGRVAQTEVNTQDETGKD